MKLGEVAEKLTGWAHASKKRAMALAVAGVLAVGGAGYAAVTLAPAVPAAERGSAQGDVGKKAQKNADNKAEKKAEEAEAKNKAEEKAAAEKAAAEKKAAEEQAAAEAAAADAAVSERAAAQAAQQESYEPAPAPVPNPAPQPSGGGCDHIWANVTTVGDYWVENLVEEPVYEDQGHWTSTTIICNCGATFPLSDIAAHEQHAVNHILEGTPDNYWFDNVWEPNVIQTGTQMVDHGHWETRTTNETVCINCGAKQ